MGSASFALSTVGCVSAFSCNSDSIAIAEGLHTPHIAIGVKDRAGADFYDKHAGVARLVAHEGNVVVSMHLTFYETAAVNAGILSGLDELFISSPCIQSK